MLAKPDFHWKKGRSAMCAAACWEDSQPNLPPEILDVLNESKDKALTNLELLIAVPEWQVKLSGGDTPSQTDILALARNEAGLAVIGVEAKVDEPFGPTLKEKKTNASQGQLDRITYLEKELECQASFEGHIRYQLLHRTVSALLTARAFHASTAIMLVQSFSQQEKWREDFEVFCNALGCSQQGKDIRRASRSDEFRLFLGWCQGDKKYLDIDLASDF